MNSYELVARLRKIQGMVKSSYLIMEEHDCALEHLLHAIRNDIDYLIIDVHDDVCCSEHFMNGGVCSSDEGEF